MIRYFIGIIAISSSLLLLDWLPIPLPWQFHPLFPWMICFFFLQSTLVSWVLNMGEKDRPRFVLYALGSLSLRLITAVFFLLILIIAEIENLQPLIIQFAGVYLCYLAFEMILVFSNLRPNSGKNNSK